MNSDETPAAQGFDIPAFLQTLTQRPGIYKMLDADGVVIYVGKAKNLKKRVSSYFLNKEAAPKQQAMVARIASIEVTVTHTEGEALLLESQWVKRIQPRYNISLRDGKTFPYIHVTTQQTFPRIGFYRGSRKKQGRFFGPYPSAGAVRECLKLLQKIFPVRQCEDSVFNNRSRPCLQYQIERCSGPCVGLIAAETYAEDVEDTIMFLEGNGKGLIDELVRRMEIASTELRFEKAARYRDQIANLRTILAKQAVTGEQGDLDIVACAIKGHLACVQVMFIRGGQQIGDSAFFPKMADEHSAAHVLEAFLGQYYLNVQVPREILLSHDIDADTRRLLEEVLTAQAKHAVHIGTNTRGERLKRVQLAQTNAENSLQAKLANQQDLYARFLSLGEALHRSEPPRRLECFDISHMMGEQTVASCVVFDRQGAVKSAYRRFNIAGIEPGDDYAALAQAVTRRYQRIKKGEFEAPDILLIDGGKGQVSAVKEALESIAMEAIYVLGVAKGPDRKPGMEMLFPAGQNQPILLPSHTPALLLIQQIRDEAHRFAITGHRQRRAKAKTQSSLELIEGLGPKRRQQLLKQFGGLREISRADVNALCSVEGINRQLAQRIYETFHEQEA
jgi:excinuclease ABC subunit C